MVTINKRRIGQILNKKFGLLNKYILYCLVKKKKEIIKKKKYFNSTF